jgi:hypothetical protein
VLEATVLAFAIPYLWSMQSVKKDGSGDAPKASQASK